MAGADQKSFLGAFSPWATPRSSTPRPESQTKPEALQRSTGEDHTVTHRHRVNQRLYPADCPPLKVRWFYAVDAPKRKPALLDTEKKAEQKPLPKPKKFVPFSVKDSLSIESTFQQLSDFEEASKSSQPSQTSQQSPTKNVPVNEDYLFDVNIEARELSPAYWVGPVYEVRRGTWFFQEGSALRPCEENLATQLEEGYLKLRPWRTEASEGSAIDTSLQDGQKEKPATANQQSSAGVAKQADTSKTSAAEAGNDPAVSSSPSKNTVYSGPWINTDDFVSRVSTTVFQKLGRAPGTKVVRGLLDLRKGKESSENRGSERRPTESASNTANPSPPTGEMEQKVLVPGSSPSLEKTISTTDPTPRRPKSTLERQMSSLAGEPQNSAELEEEARQQEEKEMEDSREVENEDRERDIDHLVLVTHGIGQRLGLRLESINFIHDVNVLRKTLKTVYKASPDLQALNSAFADSKDNCRVQVLPVCWRHLLDFPYRGVRQNRKELDLTDADSLEDDAYPSLADITLESVPAVRNLISDLAMDVLLYQSGYCDHISNIVKQECNRILQLYKERNPSFHGTVSLVGHSLGSAILFDILCHQPDMSSINEEQKLAADGSDDMKSHRRRTNALNFECEEFFCLGSPLALFQMLKGKTVAGYSPVGGTARDRKNTLDSELKSFGSMKHSKKPSHSNTDFTNNSALISAPKCRDIYNIFHPSDPVSYRLEPLISPAMATLKPQSLPSVKKSLWTASGQSLSILRDRMGQSVGSLWTNITSGVASSLLNRHLGLTAEDASAAAKANQATGHKRTQSGSPREASQEDEHFHILIDPDIETLYDGLHQGTPPEEQDRKMKFEDAKVRALNANGRVDYSIQEGAFDISLIASIASHLTYWGDEDVNHFMLSQMLSRKSRHRMNAELQQVHKVWERTRTNSPIYEFLLNEVEIYEAERGLVRARLQLGPRQLNSKGSVHGAFSATVTDWAGGMAIATHGLDSTGVSTDIHVTYLSMAIAGDWIEIESRASKVGKSLAFTTVTISKRTEEGLTIVAQGTHTKYVRTRSS
ncbi:hypothetical protein N7468_002838 [Penicillium chermesinum]|uniref:DDHD domain-containing protein n=1 Tax=Penicillium chermesinum TaxID=63820 RepID=A0A9W9TY03_9EURO|nr:uncharacterized protein N7468_002838 [Penicillium chermesinum]KAJ5247855.1 hypothetical protein N7468_002838 [Penicillium chermesinum]